MSNLRDFLLSAGVSPRDISEAVRDARHLTEKVKHWSAFAESLLVGAARRTKPDSKARKVAIMGLKGAVTVNRGASELLGKNRRQT